MGYVFITPDSPLMMFWAAGLYYTFMALKYGKTKDFIISGFLVGAMMLKKDKKQHFFIMKIIFKP